MHAAPVPRRPDEPHFPRPDAAPSGDERVRAVHEMRDRVRDLPPQSSLERLRAQRTRAELFVKGPRFNKAVNQAFGVKSGSSLNDHDLKAIADEYVRISAGMILPDLTRTPVLWNTAKRYGVDQSQGSIEKRLIQVLHELDRAREDFVDSLGKPQPAFTPFDLLESGEAAA